MSASTETASREIVLRRIRAGNGGVSTRERAETEWREIPRAYRRASAGMHREGVLELLEDRLRDYDAHIVRAAEGDVAATIGAMLAERGRVRMLGASGVRAEWLPDGLEFAVDDGLSTLALDRFEGVLTESTVAIAETGTIVLETVPGQGRRAISLVPDFHICLVRARDVVATVPEAFEVLGKRRVFGTSFVSGPSATADIEMTRIKGVHGPRFLDVVLVMDERVEAG